MRKLITVLSVLITLSGGYALAQQATLNAPVARASEDNLRVESYTVSRDNGGYWTVQVSVRDNAGNEIRRLAYVGPDATHPGSTAATFNSALISVRATETGTDARKANFRILGYLSDNSYVSGVTLVP